MKSFHEIEKEWRFWCWQLGQWTAAELRRSGFDVNTDPLRINEKR